jgi:hypothetical protein
MSAAIAGEADTTLPQNAKARTAPSLMKVHRVESAQRFFKHFLCVFPPFKKGRQGGI